MVAFTVEPNQNRNGEPTGQDKYAEKSSRSQRSPIKNVPEKSKTNPSSQERKGGDYVITHPIQGVMTNYGYTIPDPHIPNRFTIWFTGGTVEFDDSSVSGDGCSTISTEREALLEEWRRVFDPKSAPSHSARTFARALAARVLLGAHIPDSMNSDGMLSYTLRRPIGGHSVAFVDILHLDNDLRVMKGHKDQLYVCARVDSELSYPPSSRVGDTYQR